MDVHGEHEALSIHEQMPLPALDLLGAVIASLPSHSRGFDALTVNDAGAGMRLPASGYAEPLT
jgi:hypothetical protein